MSKINKSIRGSRRFLFAKRPETRLALAIILFVVSLLASRGEKLNNWETEIFDVVYRLPDFLYPLFLLITQLGGVAAAFIVLIVSLFKNKILIFARLLMSSTLAYTLAEIAKNFVGRARPFELMNGVINKDYLVKGSGFPSGHMALVTALSLTLIGYLPRKYRWVIPSAIIGVAISRIYLGVHAPLDIIGGFAIGWFCAEIVRFVIPSDLRNK